MRGQRRYCDDFRPNFIFQDIFLSMPPDLFSRKFDEKLVEKGIVTISDKILSFNNIFSSMVLYLFSSKIDENMLKKVLWRFLTKFHLYVKFFLSMPLDLFSRKIDEKWVEKGIVTISDKISFLRNWYWRV